MMQQAQRKSAATRADASDRPFAQSAYSQGCEKCSLPVSTLACRSGTSKKPPPTPTPDHYALDRARASLDRHATYIVAAFVAGAITRILGLPGRKPGGPRTGRALRKPRIGDGEPPICLRASARRFGRSDDQAGQSGTRASSFFVYCGCIFAFSEDC